MRALKNTRKERFLSKIQDLTFDESSISKGKQMSNPEFCFGMTSIFLFFKDLNILQKIIITLAVISLLLLTGCRNSTKNQTDQLQKDPDFISDQYGFKIFELDDYSVDTEEAVLARNVLTLKKGEVRVRFGFFKGAKMNMNLMGITGSSDKQLLFEWAMNSVQIPQFFPGITKFLLKWEYGKVAEHESIITDILLEGPVQDEESDKTKIVKLRKSDNEFFKAHNRVILRNYVFYRGDDLFSIEFLADPLTYHAEITNFENNVLISMTMMEKGS